MTGFRPLLAIVVVAGLLMLMSLPGTSPVYDEPYHMMRGMAAYWTGDLRLSYDHPPLANLLEVLPAVPFTPEPYPIVETNSWGQAAYKPLARAWLRDDYASFWRALSISRGVVVLMTLGLVVAVHRFCARWYDGRTATVAALLVASQPAVLAHGRFVTTDLPVALAMMLAVAAFVRYLHERNIAWALVTSTAVAAAMLVKFSGLVLALVFFALTLAALATGRGRLRRLGRASLHLVSGGALVCLLVSAAYRFEDTGWTVRDTLQQPVQRALRGHRQTAAGSSLRALPPGLRIPLPRRYVLGAAATARRAAHGRGTHFLGREHERGTPWFFPVLLLVKLTPALLLGLGVAAVVRMRGKGLPRAATSVVLVVAGALLLGAVRSRLNLGFRHVLPAIPLLSILAARGLSLAWESASRWRRRLLIALLATAPVGALLEHPDYLGYFNVFVGGRAQGHRITLVGEDWGQDVAALAEWAAAHPDRAIAYHAYAKPVGYHEIRYRGLDPDELRCGAPLPQDGWVAVHAVVVQRGACFPTLRIGDEDVSLADHILLFDMRNKT